MPKIHIMLDSSADLPKEIQDERNIHVEPLRVLLGDREGLDGVEITPNDIYEYFAKTKKTPKTAAIEPERFERVFKELTADGGEVIYISISSTLSACYNNARLASENIPGVYVIDSLNLCSGASLLALYADDLMKKGLGAKEIVERVEKRKPFVRLSLIVENMVFLYKGGRCSGITALIANVLKIKPTIILHPDGKLTVGKKFIGSASKALIKYAADVLKKADNVDKKYFFLTHTSAPRAVLDEIRGMIEEALPGVNIIENIPNATITSHTGQGGIGLIYINDGGVTD